MTQLIPQLRSYARSLLRRKDAADDLVQDCLQRALEKVHLWQRGSNMRAWLFTIMHNIHANNARRYYQGPAFVSSEQDGDIVYQESATSTGSDELAMEMRDLESALNSLTPEQREIIHLVGVEELSYNEVASILNIPVGTVMSRLHRAREQLRVLMYGGKPTHLRSAK